MIPYNQIVLNSSLLITNLSIGVSIVNEFYPTFDKSGCHPIIPKSTLCLTNLSKKLPWKVERFSLSIELIKSLYRDLFGSR